MRTVAARVVAAAMLAGLPTVVGVAAAEAQRAAPAGIERPGAMVEQGARPARDGPIVDVRRSLRAVPRDLAPLASLLLPGAGQAMLGRDRMLAYLSLEAFSWLQWRKDERDGARERRRYRALARDVARASFGGDRPDGRWKYYEDMERYLESGQYSLSATTLIPEPDTLTYNGARWLLARRTYWTNPSVPPPATSMEYQRALAFYDQEAVGPEFRWSWRNAQLQWDLFRQSIDRANDSARRARGAVTIIVANHLLSAVDAFATVRLEGGTRDGLPEHRLRVVVPVGR